MRKRIRTINGHIDLGRAGFGDVRRLDVPLAGMIAEMDIHVRTLEALSSPLSFLLKLLAEPADLQNDDLIASVWTGAIIQYCRCFEPSYKKGLVAEDVFPEEPALASHRNALHLRSKHLAHDVNGYRFCHVGVEVSEDGDLGNVVRSFGQHAPAIEDVAALLGLALRAAAHATVRRRELTRELAKELHSKSPSELLALPSLHYEGLNRTPLLRSRRGGIN